MIATDALTILIVAFAGYTGTRRGFVLVGAELVGFFLAASIGLGIYHPVGHWFVSWLSISLPLADVAAFMITWILIELAFALLVRFTLVPRLTPQVQFSKPNRIGGAAASALRALILIAIALIIFVGLPLSSAIKQPVTGSYVARVILGATTSWQNLISRGLGQDLNSSLTVFTVSNDPESTERIQLGFTTTNVSVDVADENADLVLVNHERTSRGIAPLIMNAKAQAVARAYGERMFADGVFSHIDNDGHNPFQRMEAGGVKFNAAGENLALAPTLQLAHQGLMNSPPHKANILDPSYHTVGIGIINGGQYGLMVVQDFTN